MSVATAERTAAAQAPREAPEAKLPAISAPRLDYHPAVEERYGVDLSGWRVLVDAIFPSAKTVEGVILALGYCKRRNLDVFKRVVHVVPVWNSALRREVEGVWPGIAELRTTASRTGQYAGIDEAEFGPEIEVTYSGDSRGQQSERYNITVKHPEWCRMTVYKLVSSHRCAFKGPKCYYREWFGLRKGAPVPNERWTRAAVQMLEKVAEAAALRRAFPEELGSEPTAEEMEGQIIDIAEDGEARHPGGPVPPRPAKPEPQAPAPTLYPAMDAFGNAVGEYPSGDWLDKAQSYVERLEPSGVATWFEWNQPVLDDLAAALGAQAVTWFTYLREGIKAAPPAEAKAATPVPTTALQTPAPPKDVGTTALQSPKPPAHTGRPPAAGSRFEIKNWRGETKHTGVAPGDYERSLTWIMGVFNQLGADDRVALRKHNVEWLLDAHQAGAMNEAVQTWLLPPEPPAAAAPKPAPIPQTPPPPPEPAQAPPAPEPVAATTPAATAPEAASAPPPAADKVKRTRKPKETQAPEATAPASPDLDARFQLATVPYAFDVSNYIAYYSAMQKEMQRLKEAKAPPEAFARFREINAANIEQYREKSKTWCHQLERTLESLARPS